MLGNSNTSVVVELCRFLLLPTVLSFLYPTFADYSTHYAVPGLWSMSYLLVTLIYKKVAPTGSLLKRRRSWELFLEQSDCSGAEAAILVVNKKSSFTLEDARLAVAIVHDEISSRNPRAPMEAHDGSETNPVSRQVLLATRSSVAPAADVFIQGLRHSTGDIFSRTPTSLIRWKELTRLVHDGAVGSFFDDSRGMNRGNISGSGGFSLPSWLVEEREKERRERGEQLFDIEAPFLPSGDQPDAIEALTQGLASGKQYQTLLGATGTVRNERVGSLSIIPS